MDLGYGKNENQDKETKDAGNLFDFDMDGKRENADKDKNTKDS